MAGTAARVRAMLGTVVLIALGAVELTSGVATAGTSPPSWKVGDCFEEVDLEAAAIDLATKVACTKDHAAQVIGGAELPTALSGLTRAELLAETGANQQQLSDFVAETCAASEVVGNVYPKKTAKALATLFDEYDADAWIPPLAGALTIVLPDTNSFDAGATDVLCVYLPDESFSGTTAGDARRVGSGDLLEDLRICYVRQPGVGTDLSSCAEDHDFEALIFVGQDVSGRPDDPNQWTAADWADFDDMCAELGPVVVGANRKDLAFRSNTQPDQPAVDGYRYIYCEALPAAEGKVLPGGTTVNAIGKKAIKFKNA